MARVKSVSFGYTQNLGNFQSRRLDVTVEGDAQDTADRLIEIAVALVDEAVGKDLDDRQLQVLDVYRQEERNRLAQVEIS